MQHAWESCAITMSVSKQRKLGWPRSRSVGQRGLHAGQRCVLPGLGRCRDVMPCDVCLHPKCQGCGCPSAPANTSRAYMEPAAFLNVDATQQPRSGVIWGSADQLRPLLVAALPRSRLPAPFVARQSPNQHPAHVSEPRQQQLATSPDTCVRGLPSAALAAHQWGPRAGRPSAPHTP